MKLIVELMVVGFLAFCAGCVAQVENRVTSFVGSVVVLPILLVLSLLPYLRPRLKGKRQQG
jgi:hypothetical protein